MFKNIWASSSVPSKEWTTPPNIWSLCFLSILRTSVAAFRQCRNRGSLCFFAKSSWLSKYLNKCYLQSAMLYLKYIIIVLNNWNFSTTAYDVILTPIYLDHNLTDINHVLWKEKIEHVRKTFGKCSKYNSPIVKL